jgi:hypothetical protein
MNDTGNWVIETNNGIGVSLNSHVSLAMVLTYTSSHIITILRSTVKPSGPNMAEKNACNKVSSAYLDFPPKSGKTVGLQGSCCSEQYTSSQLGAAEDLFLTTGAGRFVEHSKTFVNMSHVIAHIANLDTHSSSP